MPILAHLVDSSSHFNVSCRLGTHPVAGAETIILFVLTSGWVQELQLARQGSSKQHGGSEDDGGPVFGSTKFQLDFLTRPSILGDIGLDFGKVKFAERVKPSDELFICAYPHFNVQGEALGEPCSLGKACVHADAQFVGGVEPSVVRRPGMLCTIKITWVIHRMSNVQDVHAAVDCSDRSQVCSNAEHNTEGCVWQPEKANTIPAVPIFLAQSSMKRFHHS